MRRGDGAYRIQDVFRGLTDLKRAIQFVKGVISLIGFGLKVIFR